MVAISSLHYPYDSQHHIYVLISGSTDGHVLVWCLDNVLRAPYEGYHLAPKHGVYTGQNATLSNRYNTLGCTAIAVYHHGNSSKDNSTVKQKHKKSGASTSFHNNTVFL